MGVKSRFDANPPEHADLVAELPTIEKMSTTERLKHAKKRRAQQLKKYGTYEKQLEKDQRSKKKQEKKPQAVSKATGRTLHFPSSVMLLEAAARNDVEEGETFKFDSGSVVKCWIDNPWYVLLCWQNTSLGIILPEHFAMWTMWTVGDIYCHRKTFNRWRK